MGLTIFAFLRTERVESHIQGLANETQETNICKRRNHNNQCNKLLPNRPLAIHGANMTMNDITCERLERREETTKGVMASRIHGTKIIQEERDHGHCRSGVWTLRCRRRGTHRNEVEIARKDFHDLVHEPQFTDFDLLLLFREQDVIRASIAENIRDLIG